MYRQVVQSQTLLMNTLTKNLTSQNKKIIKFGFGQSPFQPPEYVIEALKRSAHHKEYTSVEGKLELREQITEFHLLHNGLSVKPENILVAPGSKTLIYTVLMAFNKADVFIPAPAWVSYAPQAKLAGHHIVKLPTAFDERWRIQPRTLKKAFQNKKYTPSILILNYPGNPDGQTYTDLELRGIAEMARELNILVISDEIYGLLDHGNDHYSFSTYYPEKTITTTGLSKWCGAGGWRLGAALLYDTIEPDFKQALIGIASETYSCAPAPVQMAAIEAYSQFNNAMEYVRHQTKIYKEIGNFCARKLNEVGIKVHFPEGGFYIFPDFSEHEELLHSLGISTSEQLCENILSDTGVALLPATAFGFETTYLGVRLAYVDFEDNQNSQTFNLERDAPNVVEGIQLMGDWISSL